MNRKELDAKIKDNLRQANKLVSEAINLAETHKTCFSYQPEGMGFFRPNLTLAEALKFIESGEYADLDGDMQELVDKVIENQEDHDGNFFLLTKDFYYVSCRIKRFKALVS